MSRSRRCPSPHSVLLFALGPLLLCGWHPARAETHRPAPGTVATARTVAPAADPPEPPPADRMPDGSLTNDHVARARDLFTAGQFKEAAEILEQLVRERPDHFDSLYNLGLAREAQNDMAAAAAVYARAVRSKPADVDARLRLTETLRKAGRFADALAAGKEALTLAQKLSAPAALQAQIFDELGLCQRRLGDLKAAEASFRSALAQAPALPAVRLHLATTLAAAGRCPEALRQADSLPKTAPFAEQVAKLRAGCSQK